MANQADNVKKLATDDSDVNLTNWLFADVSTYATPRKCFFHAFTITMVLAVIFLFLFYWIWPVSRMKSTLFEKLKFRELRNCVLKEPSDCEDAATKKAGEIVSTTNFHWRRVIRMAMWFVFVLMGLNSMLNITMCFALFV